MSRFIPTRRRLALIEYRKQRRIWSKPVAYWIAVWRHGVREKPILAVYMLAALGVSKREIEHYETYGLDRSWN